jgi:hypothetical protein
VLNFSGQTEHRSEISGLRDKDGRILVRLDYRFCS